MTQSLRLSRGSQALQGFGPAVADPPRRSLYATLLLARNPAPRQMMAISFPVDSLGEGTNPAKFPRFQPLSWRTNRRTNRQGLSPSTTAGNRRCASRSLRQDRFLHLRPANHLEPWKRVAQQGKKAALDGLLSRLPRIERIVPCPIICLSPQSPRKHDHPR